MIVYHANKGKFLDDVLSNNVDGIILNYVKQKLNKGVSPGEIRSWRESLSYMDRILQDAEIPEDCGVAIEYMIPQTGKRIDFILTGQGISDTNYAIIIELKQWSEADITSKDGVVVTYVGGRKGEHTHPSYQAWSYATLLQGFNEAVYNENIQLKPCAYLHNYVEDDVIRNSFYAEYIEKAPIFLKSDAIKLRDFIKRFVKYGDRTDIIYRIEEGKIKPSKMLADSMVSMLKGNQEFLMIDDQKIVYENALSLARQSSPENKNVLIVQGGPGTGKSVIAINLLVEITKMGLLSQYVSKNAAPRAVYEARLTGKIRATEIRNLFKGSGSFIEVPNNYFDTLIVDEAHRLNEFSGLYGNLGENQIKEIINASKFTVFFIDEDQRVTLKDIGQKNQLQEWAYKANATVYELELNSQFRCNGSDGYLAWLDNALEIRETANQDVLELGYDFRVVDSPSELRDLIFEKNKINNKARLVAGYCWKWISKGKRELYDITFPEYGFQMKWNLTSDGSLWIISPDSVNEIGCIHTCQGLEVDYIGVIIGNDIIVRNGHLLVDPSKRASSDMSIRGYKKLLQADRVNTQKSLSAIIKNTYRTLMTRGIKGCFIYCVDKETQEYFKNLLNPSKVLN